MKLYKFVKEENSINYIKLFNKEKNFNKISFVEKNKIKIFIIFIIVIFAFVIVKISYNKIIKNLSTIKSKQTDSKIELLKIMTYNDISLYNGTQKCLLNNSDEELCIYHFLCPKNVKGKTRILLGDKGDGSYVILDDFEDVKIAYSIGIRDIIQFDKALADRGIDVYMYDHTIDKLPYENNKFHWKKIGIGGISERSNNIQTLEEMMKENGHLKEKNMILKIDVEGAEWNSLNDVSEKILLQYKYILIEYHFRTKRIALFYNILKKINKSHQSFYVHCSPFSHIIIFGNNRICSAIEVSYIIRKGYNFEKDDSIYPIQEFSYGAKEYYNINILSLFDN